MEKILCFQAHALDIQVIKHLHMRYTIVPESDYIKTLAQLVGFQVTEKVTVKSNSTLPLQDQRSLPQAGILVFCNVKNSHMDRLLKMLHSAGRQETYKAVLTPTNANWNVYRLANELEQERQQLINK